MIWLACRGVSIALVVTMILNLTSYIRCPSKDIVLSRRHSWCGAVSGVSCLAPSSRCLCSPWDMSHGHVGHDIVLWSLHFVGPPSACIQRPGSGIQHFLPALSDVLHWRQPIRPTFAQRMWSLRGFRWLGRRAQCRVPRCRSAKLPALCRPTRARRIRIGPSPQGPEGLLRSLPRRPVPSRRGEVRARRTRGRPPAVLPVRSDLVETLLATMLRSRRAWTLFFVHFPCALHSHGPVNCQMDAASLVALSQFCVVCHPQLRTGITP